MDSRKYYYNISCSKNVEIHKKHWRNYVEKYCIMQYGVHSHPKSEPHSRAFPCYFQFDLQEQGILRQSMSRPPPPEIQDGAARIISRFSKKTFPLGHRVGHPHVCVTTDAFHRLLEKEKPSFHNRCPFAQNLP